MKRVIAMTEQAAGNIAKLLGTFYKKVDEDFVVDVPEKYEKEVDNILCDNECAFHDITTVPKAFITDIQLQYANITLLQEEIEILDQFKNRLINVTELCNKLGGYGMQVVKLGDGNVTLCTNAGEDELKEVIISFVVEL